MYTELAGQAMSADDIATASAKAKKEEAGANVCPGLISLWQWFIARLGQLGSAKATTSEPQFAPGPACLRGTDTVAAICCRRSAQPLHAMERSSTTHSHTAQEEPSAQPLGGAMHACPRCPYPNL